MRHQRKKKSRSSFDSLLFPFLMQIKILAVLPQSISVNIAAACREYMQPIVFTFFIGILQRKYTTGFINKPQQQKTLIFLLLRLGIYNKGPNFMCVEEKGKNKYLGLLYITMLAYQFYGKHFSR